MHIEMRDFWQINACWIRDKRLKVFRKVRKITIPGYFCSSEGNICIVDSLISVNS